MVGDLLEPVPILVAGKFNAKRGLVGKGEGRRKGDLLMKR